MKKMPENLRAPARGVLVAVLAAALLWQTTQIGATIYRSWAVDRTVDRWEALHRKPEEAKPSAENGKPAPPEDTTPGSPQPPRPEPPKQAAPPEPEKPAEDKYAALVKMPLFGPPLPQAPPPTLTAIIGDMALINDQPARVNDNVGGYKVVEITSSKVILEKDGNKTELTLAFGGGGAIPGITPAQPPNKKKEAGPQKNAQPKREEAPASAPPPEVMQRMEMLGGPFGMPADGSFTIEVDGTDPF
jgi:hypothetical protein